MSNVITLYAGDDMKVLAEVSESGEVFLHTYVYEFSKSQLKWSRIVFNSIKEEMYLAGFNSAYCYTRNSRYAKAVNPSFRTLGDFELAGDVLEVLEWDLTR